MGIGSEALTGIFRVFGGVNGGLSHPLVIDVRNGAVKLRAAFLVGSA